MKILIIRTSSLGDVVMTTPVIEFLKKSFDNCEIHFLVDKKYSPLLKNHPYISKIIEIDLSGKSKNIVRLFKEIIRVIKTIKNEKYDIAFDFQGLLRSVIFSWFSSAKNKFGRGKWLFLDGNKPHKKTLAKHNVYQNYEITKLAGLYPDVKYSQNIFFSIKEVNPFELADVHLQSFDKIVAVNPWTRWESKSAPPELLAESCNKLAKLIRCHFFILGSKNENLYAERVYSLIDNPKSFLTGKLNLNELAGFLYKSDLLITCDTGPMHIASALGTPIVALFGPTHPLRTGPFEGTFEIITNPLKCTPCFKKHCKFKNNKCISGISSEEIANTAYNLLR